MRFGLLAFLFIGLSSAAQADDFQLSKITVPSLGNEQETIDAVEGAIKDEAGVLSLRIEGSRTLQDIVAAECPGATEPYLAAFPKDVARLNPKLFEGKAEVPLATPIGSSGYAVTPLYIPYCLGAFSEKHVVKEGDSLWKIYNERRQQENGVTKWEDFLPEASRLNGDVVEQKTLEPGTVIVVPNASWQVPVAKGKAEGLMHRLEAIAPINGKVQVDDKSNWGTRNSGEEENENCADVSELDALKGAESRLWDVADTLMLNDALDERFALRRSKSVVNVAVLDSGVSAPRHPAMKRLLLKLITDDDVAFPNDPLGFHGTGVLFTAAGGYLLSALNPLGIPVQVAAYNLYRSVCTVPDNCTFVADPNRLNTAMRQAFDRQTATSGVNISVSFPGADPLPWFIDYVGTDKDVLIVTSAGNDGTEIGHANKIFPAVFGGSEGTNLITVASLDLHNDLLPRSNYSKEVVDIAAWGCNVPVAEFDPAIGGFVRKLRSGTSYAAPQVLFAAAMIQRERPRRINSGPTPSEVKIRLMTSADHALGLWQKVRHGRILNLAKALSIHSDVVQLKDSGILLRGQIDFGSGAGGFVTVCGAQTIARDELLSINDLGSVPEAGADRVLIYRHSKAVAGEVETRWCNGITTDVTLLDPFTRQKTPIPTSNISSITLATYPNLEQ
ncbi:S8 family serine peptidase [Mesorhizobium sp.]|uniref:S8 family serine peptidase n=1 Tax=Mesorhizobium sp. TaxID=1871066 RepID=UPI001207894F|nr:S8 family serine peptidase [Mesorhizobium sp.]TIT02673.1 MAG: hypothetical protein E5W87_09165 [Mesorhizobium sp.]